MVVVSTIVAISAMAVSKLLACLTAPLNANPAVATDTKPNTRFKPLKEVLTLLTLLSVLVIDRSALSELRLILSNALDAILAPVTLIGISNGTCTIIESQQI